MQNPKPSVMYYNDKFIERITHDVWTVWRENSCAEISKPKL